MRGKRKSAGGSSSSYEAPQPPLQPSAAHLPLHQESHALGSDVGLASAAELERREMEAERGNGEEEREDFDDDDDDDEEEEEEGDEEDRSRDEVDLVRIQEVEAELDRPKLAEGFYEIEAVRRKRVRKGEVQYLIKWRGWPEKANTWEPVGNLQSCLDIIDAFEESSQSGKHRTSRKRKRRFGGSCTQPKKQQQLSPAAATYSVPTVKVRISDEPVPFASLNDSWVANEDGVKKVEGVNKQAIESGVAVASDHTEHHTQNDLDLKLGELKGSIPTNCQKAYSSEVDGLADGVAKTEFAEPIQAGRCLGAKRRKSGSVKRFKQETDPCEPNARRATLRNAMGPCSRVGWQEIRSPKSVGRSMALQNTIDTSTNVPTIVEIVKPISYSSSGSNNIQDVSVTFVATRSDGKEVMVDNKFLKANNPLLLINFYERHLRYSPT